MICRCCGHVNDDNATVCERCRVSLQDGEKNVKKTEHDEEEKQDRVLKKRTRS